MSDSYDLGCNDCCEVINIGQAAGDTPFCFYYGEPETMKLLRNFLYAHREHHLEFNIDQLLWYKYGLAENLEPKEKS